ncbi:MAG: DUF4830 domain-containing protein [Clostridia bacterium]|nr:DUF4830 domain-containing protein [Clostridia bacterium]
MFVYSAKMNKKKLLAAAVSAAVVLAVAVIVICSGGRADRPDPQGTTAQSDRRSAELRMVKKAKLRNAEEVLKFITELGWSVEPEPLEVTEVCIPSEFSEVYERYNDLQKTQGLDLSGYKGQSATRYSYKLTGHPSGESEVILTLLVKNGRLIGGDVSTARYDGFMHSLLPSDAHTSALPPEESVMTEDVSADPTLDPYPAD